VSDLKEAGHDLWTHDYDGSRCMLWGWDYMHPETAGKLQLQFVYRGPVLTFWRTDDPQLAAVAPRR
jgi:hypothetical protein